MIDINALDEISHQILQMRDLSNPKIGLKVNWTLARSLKIALIVLASMGWIITTRQNDILGQMSNMNLRRRVRAPKRRVNSETKMIRLLTCARRPISQ